MPTPRQVRIRVLHVLRPVYLYQRKREVEWQRAVDGRAGELAWSSPAAKRLPSKQRERLGKLKDGKATGLAFTPEFGQAWGLVREYLDQGERELRKQQGIEGTKPGVWEYVVERMAGVSYRTPHKAFEQELREYCGLGPPNENWTRTIERLDGEDFGYELLRGIQSEHPVEARKIRGLPKAERQPGGQKDPHKRAKRTEPAKNDRKALEQGGVTINTINTEKLVMGDELHGIEGSTIINRSKVDDSFNRPAPEDSRKGAEAGPPRRVRRIASWVVDHIVATLVAGVLLAALLAWLGLG